MQPRGQGLTSRVWAGRGRASLSKAVFQGCPGSHAYHPTAPHPQGAQGTGGGDTDHTSAALTAWLRAPVPDPPNTDTCSSIQMTPTPINGLQRTRPQKPRTHTLGASKATLVPPTRGTNSSPLPRLHY